MQSATRRLTERLKRGQATVAREHADATILFADIVGFTGVAARSTAADLVALLNELFSAFDDIADAEGVERIKTIGDAYMAAAGVPEPCADHAVRVARVALRMLGALETSRRRHGHALALRIGIHSGSVVAGVIGKRKFAYDLWGESVNIASRLESTSQPGAIQVSAATRVLLDGHFAFSAPRRVELRGIGAVEASDLLGTAGPG